MTPSNVIETINPYNSNKSNKRKGIIVLDSWNESIHKFIKDNNIEALYINYAKGWDSNDYSFLSKLKEIKELNIISGGGDLSCISEMTNLEELSISYSHDGVIDFSKLEKLETCFLGYSKKIDSLFKAQSLKHLSLDEFKFKDYQKISELINLKHLTISNSNIDSIEFLNNLYLESLELVNCRKLLSFEQISTQKELINLIIDGCSKLYNLDFLKNLQNLEWLSLSFNKNLESINSLKELYKLRTLTFMQTSIEDGDLKVLTTLENLLMLRFNNKKHYNLKLNQICLGAAQGIKEYELIEK